MIANQGGSGAYGTMQIKASDWGWVANTYGYDLQTREGKSPQQPPLSASTVAASTTKNGSCRATTRCAILTARSA
jgi:hypothetical protein